MRFDIFTLFPGIFDSPLRESMLKRAIDVGPLEVQLHNIRDYAAGRHQVTDDYPYGGGGGMVMKPEPVFAAVERVLGLEVGNWKLEVGNWKLEDGVIADSATSNLQPPISNLQPPISNLQSPISNIPIVLLTPQGRVFDQRVAYQLAGHDGWR